MIENGLSRDCRRLKQEAESLANHEASLALSLHDWKEERGLGVAGGLEV